MEREIKMEKGEQLKLQKMFKASHVTVRKALRGQAHSLLAQKIRFAAKKMGGREIEYVDNKQLKKYENENEGRIR
jgi:hypothetical protein